MDVIVVGCGASGMAAAISASERGRHVLILEKGDRPGRKILASGNGRCNLMNSGFPRYYGDSDFAYTVISQQSPQMITHFFNRYGLVLTELEEGRIYPRSLQSSSVMSVLKNALNYHHVSVCLNQKVTSVKRNNKAYQVITENGDEYIAPNVIISCGGAAQSKLGGSYDGYTILRNNGHSIIPIRPALVPLITENKCISGLAGIRARCTVSVCYGDHIIHMEKGEILFTDYGVSGICIMQCARFITNNDIHLEIDFFQDLFENDLIAIHELQRRKRMFPDTEPTVLLNGILADRISYAILKQAGISMRGERLSSLSDQDLFRIVHSAKRYKINVTGTKGYQFAQVTAGGIDCQEFDPKSMESRISPGLYATGEVLNVDGDCGGYNLMFALSSGLVAGNAV